MGPSLCVHDHVVLLLSPNDFENPPAWLSENFNILEGGVHAGWSTACSLSSAFPDSVYRPEQAHCLRRWNVSELFCWIDTPREFYAWANKSPGLIDFALTSIPPSTAQSLHSDIVSRLGKGKAGDELGIDYTVPAAGSRSRADGVQVQWESSRPVFSKSINRTDFPFFCYDITPRSVQVPFEDKTKATYPCGAVGISTVEVIVPRSRFDKYADLYGDILGASPKIVHESSEAKRLDFEIGRPDQDFWSVNYQSPLRSG